MDFCEFKVSLVYKVISSQGYAVRSYLKRYKLLLEAEELALLLEDLGLVPSTHILKFTTANAFGSKGSHTL